MTSSSQDNATLSETLDEAKELDATVKDATKRLSALRKLAFNLIDAGKGSEGQAKAAKAIFPPRGRGASKK